MGTSRARWTGARARRSALIASTLALAITSLVASRVHADEPPCDALHVAVENQCCWPDQRVEGGRCVGAPRCPETLVEHGDECVALATTPSQPRPIATYASSDATEEEPDELAGWPTVRHDRDRPVWRVQARSTEDGGLVAASVVVIDVGWTMGWLGVLIAELGGCSGRACDGWPWAFIPVGGAMAAGVASISRGNGAAYGFGIPSVILQGIGLIMLAISLANEVTEPIHERIDLAPHLSLSLGAPESDAGASLGLAF
ncbi:MAG: hypothetical protein J0L92_17295 [Deltaproteobacteria bacterium]|nr:hypothetical protein [Deltaproteobacteria bacterium]